MKNNQGLADQVAQNLFELDEISLADALECLPIGKLWETCLPEIPVEYVFSLLGGDANEIFSQMAKAWINMDGKLLARALDLPFSINTRGNLDALGTSLFRDGSRLLERKMNLDSTVEEQGLIWGIEITHQDSNEWLEKIYACMDWAAEQVFSGEKLDSVRVLVRSPNAEIFPLIYLADTAARIRFVEAISDVDADYTSAEKLERFKNSIFRRSSAWGILYQIKQQLISIPNGKIGFSENGWPVWWQTSCTDTTAALAKLPDAVVSCAKNIKFSANAVGIDWEWVKTNQPISIPEQEDFVLVIQPQEASQLISQWPLEAYLVIIKEGDEQRWDACRQEELNRVIGLKPVWPPRFAQADYIISAEKEVSLIRHLASIPGISESARIKLEKPTEPIGEQIDSEQIEWD